MPTQKWCNVAGCKEFIFATLNDFGEYGWSAYQLPKRKARCYCPKHRKKCHEDMKKEILAQQKERKVKR